MNTKHIFGPSRIAIIGAGEFGRQAAHHIRQNDLKSLHCEIAGWYDDTFNKGEIVAGFQVLGAVDSVLYDFEDNKFECLFIAIGYNHPGFKESLIRQYKDKIPLHNIISPDAHVDPTAIIGDNIFIYPGAIIDREVKLEDGVTVNLGSIVSHNSVIGTCSFIAPGVTVAGYSKIGKRTFVGAGSTIIDNISICDNVRFGAGSVVVDDITSGGLYLGGPAKRIR